MQNYLGPLNVIVIIIVRSLCVYCSQSRVLCAACAYCAQSAHTVRSVRILCAACAYCAQPAHIPSVFVHPEHIPNNSAYSQRLLFCKMNF